jgi:oligosaccharide repeat unit polymerase
MLNTNYLRMKSIKWILLCFSSIISLLIILVTENTIWHVTAMLLLCCSAILISEFDFLHPYFWFSSFFTLYSVAYPILYSYGQPPYYGYSKELMLTQCVALIVTLVAISPIKNINYQVLKPHTLTVFNKLFFQVLGVIIFIAVLSISRGNFSGKDDIYASNSIFYYISFRVVLIFSIIYIMQFATDLLKNEKLPMRIFLISASLITLLTLYSGERDLLFRFILLTIFILYSFKRIKNKHFLIIIPALVVLLPLTHMYKYFALTGEVSTATSELYNNIFFEFLTGEFSSAASNMQIILNNSHWTEGFRGLNLLFTDILNIVSPDVWRANAWFNNYFFPGSKVQYGFTLVGEGYIMFGYLGIIFLFYLVGLFVRLLYYNSNKNIYLYTIYLYTIPIIIYSFRGDFSNITTPFVKQLLFSILIIYFFEVVGVRKNEKNN